MKRGGAQKFGPIARRYVRPVLRASTVGKTTPTGAENGKSKDTSRKSSSFWRSGQEPKTAQGPQDAEKAKAVGPPWMTKPQIAVWREQVENMPWLHAGHRLLRQVCILAARMETTREMGVSALQALGSLLSKLGATPVDETKVNHGGEEDEDPDDKLF